MTNLRMTNGWSKAELARRARVHPSQVGLIESGRFVPYTSQLTKIAKALGVDPLVVDLMAEAADSEPTATAQ